MHRKKKWCVHLMTVILAVSVTGCGLKITDKEQETENGNSQETTSENTDRTNAEQAGTEQTGTEQASTSDTADVYVHGEISITFPDTWEGKYVIVESGENISVYQKSSYDRMENMGFIFSIDVSETPYYDYPSGGMIAYTEEKAYSIIYPTDVSFFVEIPEIAEEYGEMCESMPEILYSVRILADNVHYNADEYVLPMSEYFLLSEEDIINLSETELFFARNEIFARHGYHFDNPFLQACFERCSWYEDKGDSYDAAELTEIDLTNIETIKAVEEKNSKEYPAEYNAAEEHFVDLDGDGIDEVVRYDLIREADLSIGIISVDGKAYLMDDFGLNSWNLEEEYFYITDISPYFPGLEIAIADYGPSEDLVTYFFTYNGELQYIGSVGGHPMEQLNYFNGFEDGRIIGRIRTDILGTTYGYGSWWYDYEQGELVFQETGIYYLEPWYSHELLVDLPVYLSNSEEAATVVMEAGQTVYQMQTDGREWVKLRDESGLEGWVHINNYSIENVGMGIDSVFEGVYFFD
ncbi:MAG: YARHG domain-containing protein [Lachnospiraceae bacterium]